MSKNNQYGLPSIEDINKQIGFSLGLETYEKKEGRKPIPSSIKRQRYMDSQGKCMHCNIIFAQEGLTEDYHHKDGNPANNDPINIEVLCPNCHRKETFKQFLDKQKEKIKKTKEQKNVGKKQNTNLPIAFQQYKFQQPKINTNFKF